MEFIGVGESRIQTMLAILDTRIEITYMQYEELQTKVNRRLAQLDTLSIMSALIAGFGFLLIFEGTPPPITKTTYSFAGLSPHAWLAWMYVNGVLSACTMTLCAFLSTTLRVYTNNFVYEFLKDNHHGWTTEYTDVLNKLSIPSLHSMETSGGESGNVVLRAGKKALGFMHRGIQGFRKTFNTATTPLKEMDSIPLILKYRTRLKKRFGWYRAGMLVVYIFFYTGMVSFFLSVMSSIPLHFTDRSKTFPGIMFGIGMSSVVIIVIIIV